MIIKAVFENYTLRRVYSLAANALTALVKLVAGAVSASVFIVISGFYSLGTGIAKEICYIGKKREAETGGNLYFAVAATHAVSAMLYAACAIRQLYVPPTFEYGTIAAIAVAAVAFYELGSAIAGIVRTAKKGGFALAVKRINLSKASAAIALTQIALLSSNQEGVTAAGAAMSLIAAAVMGCCALATAVQGFRVKKADKQRENTEGDIVSDKSAEILNKDETV